MSDKPVKIPRIHSIMTFGGIALLLLLEFFLLRTLNVFNTTFGILMLFTYMLSNALILLPIGIILLIVFSVFSEEYETKNA